MYTFALIACALVALFGLAAMAMTAIMERTILAGIEDDEEAYEAE